MRKSIPEALWVALVVLGAITLIQLMGEVGRGNRRVLVSFALNVAIWLGLYAGHRWAFVAVIAISAATVLILAARSPSQAMGVFVVDAFVVIPVWMARSYFWPPDAPDLT